MSAPTNTSTPQGGDASSSGGGNSGGTSGNAPTTKGHPRMYDIPFLDDDGGNFAFWRFRVRMVLELRELWDLVDGSLVKPDPAVDAAPAAEWTYKDREA